MDDYNKNLERIESFRTFMGGDCEDVPICSKALEDMKFIVEKCNEFHVPQPEIFPWAGGEGIQAEWEYDWYLEIDSGKESIAILFVKGEDYRNAVSTHIDHIKDAFLLVKEFLNHVVDMNYKSCQESEAKF